MKDNLIVFGSLGAAIVLLIIATLLYFNKEDNIRNCSLMGKIVDIGSPVGNQGFIVQLDSGDKFVIYRMELMNRLVTGKGLWDCDGYFGVG